MARGSLFQYAVLYHPNPTKQEQDLGETPKSQIVLAPDHLLAGSLEQAKTLVGRKIPENFLDKLDQLEILVGPMAA